MTREYETLPDEIKTAVDTAFNDFATHLRALYLTPPMDDRAEKLIDAMTQYVLEARK